MVTSGVQGVQLGKEIMAGPSPYGHVLAAK
jgi:hypothetical protein